jgi:hypothetical protein
MPNRDRLRGPSTRAYGCSESDAEGWVVIAFCLAGFVATVFFVFLASHIGPVAG